MILANRVPLSVWGGGCYIIGANRAGKSPRSFFNCITVTDGIKINEQYKSIGVGPLYGLYTYKPNLKRFDYFCLKLWRVLTRSGYERCNTGVEQVKDSDI